jgi:hypothetical protein
VPRWNLQAYVEPAGKTKKWRTTEQGDLVFGAKPPSFTREAGQLLLNPIAPNPALGIRISFSWRKLVGKPSLDNDRWVLFVEIGSVLKFTAGSDYHVF